MKPTVIWDFNGTLLDDVGIGIESINCLLTRRGLPIIDGLSRYHALFRFPIIDYYADLGLDVSDYDALAHEWVAEYLKRLPHAPLQRGAAEALEAIDRMGICQVLLSATEQDQLLSQVRGLGIEGYFSEIMGSRDIYAHSKIDRAKSWRGEHPERLILIGDTDHDADTARALGAECLLVPIGHQSARRLAETGCRILPSLFDLPDWISAQGF